MGYNAAFKYFEAALDSEYKAKWIEFPEVSLRIALASRKRAFIYIEGQGMEEGVGL